MILTVILTLIGLVVGSSTLRGLGALVFGLHGFLLGMIIASRTRLKRLEQEKNSLISRVTDLEKITAGLTGVAPPREKPEPAEIGPQVLPPEEDSIPPVPPHPPVNDVGIQEPDFLFEQDAGSSKLTGRLDEFTNNFKAFFTTANTLAAVGGLILFLGVGFLLKYAVEHGIFPLELRYIAAALLGLTLLVIGWILRNKKRSYALLLQGCAVGVMYITIFAAARWHGLLPLPLAFGLLTALAVLSGVLAVLQDARALASFGTLGGFMAPPLTSTGGGHHVLLFSYYALLGGGIVGTAFYKSWRELNLLGFFFTLGIGGAWGLNYYRPELFSTTEPFLIIFFLQYLAAAILCAVRHKTDLKKLVDGTLVFGLPIAAFGLQAQMVSGMEYGLAWSALALGATYIILAVTLWKYNPEFLRLLAEAFLALGVVFGSLAIPLALNGKWTSAAWALEGAALVWVGLRQSRRLSRIFGMLLQAASGAAFVLSLHPTYSGANIFGRVYGDNLGFLLLCLCGLFTGYLLWKNHDRLEKYEKPLHWFFLAWGLLWWYADGLREIDRQLSYRYEENAGIAFFALSAGLMHFVYKRLKWETLKYPIFVLLPVLLLFFGFHLAETPNRHPLSRYGWMAWPIALAIQYYILYRSEKGLHHVFRAFQHVAGLALLAGLTAWELSWALEKFTSGAGVWKFLPWGLVPGFTAHLLLCLEKRLGWPVRDQQEAYINYGAPLLLVWAWAWLIGGALTNAGSPWPMKYIPFINPLELGQLLTLAILWTWRQKAGGVGQAFPVRIPRRILNYFLGLTIFTAAHGFLARAVHYWAEVPFTFKALSANMSFQAGLSIFWTVAALGVMFTATKKNLREAWFAGAALLAGVVVKLFLVDLSKTGAVARIVSFLVVGVLMLLIGYLSPLPPASPKESDQ